MQFQTIQFGASLSRVSAAIAEMDAALAAGVTYKASFDRIKEPLERAVEHAWKPVTSLILDVAREDWNDSLTEVYYGGAPTAHTIGTVQKRVAKLISPDHEPVAKLAAAFLAEIGPVFARLTTLKGMIVKRETKAQTVAREAAYKPAPVASSVEIAIRARLTEIAEGARASIEKHYADYDRRMLALYLAADLAYPASHSAKTTFYKSPRTFFVSDRTKSQRNVEAASTVEMLLDRADRTVPPTARADAEAVIVNKAQKDADAVVTFFITKNLKKLVSVIEAKGGFASATLIGDSISGGGVEGSIAVTFADGSSFVASNSVVYVRNQQGTQFNRFPLTFHNAKLADGTTIKNVSEKKMNEIFAVAA
jgi:hypothetical protein